MIIARGHSTLNESSRQEEKKNQKIFEQKSWQRFFNEKKKIVIQYDDKIDKQSPKSYKRGQAVGKRLK